MNTKLLIAALAILGVTGATLATSSGVFAQEAGNGYPTIVSRLAEEFGLNEADVQDVFDELRADRHAEMEERQEDRLDQAVSDGQITEEQKQLILQKQEEMKAEMENNWQEREENREEHRTEMETWASENGIDLSVLMQLGPRGEGPHEHGMGMWH